MSKFDDLANELQNKKNEAIECYLKILIDTFGKEILFEIEIVTSTIRVGNNLEITSAFRRRNDKV